MMLGFLLARAGVKAVVLEKHGDFLRDFRGDTVHPSTLNVMDELGLLDEFLKLPHQKVSRFSSWATHTSAGITHKRSSSRTCRHLLLIRAPKDHRWRTSLLTSQHFPRV